LPIEITSRISPLWSLANVTSPVGFYEVPISQPEEDYDVDNDDPDSLHNEVVSVISSPFLKDKKIIDMYKVFHHGFIKNSVYPLRYRDLQLDTVATGMLGYGKYVSESTAIKITGENVATFPPNEQKNMCCLYYGIWAWHT